MSKSALLVLEDGTVFHGVSIGADGSSVGEVVFNTSMTGYQEILTDPSYSQQIVTLTYPHIGNTGTNSEDEESSSIHAQGLVIRDLPLIASNFRNEQTLSDYLKSQNIVGIADIDTRKLTRILREKGAQNGCIVAGSNLDEALALAKAKEFLLKRYGSCERSYNERSVSMATRFVDARKWSSRCARQQRATISRCCL